MRIKGLYLVVKYQLIALSLKIDESLLVFVDRIYVRLQFKGQFPTDHLFGNGNFYVKMVIGRFIGICQPKPTFNDGRSEGIVGKKILKCLQKGLIFPIDEAPVTADCQLCIFLSRQAVESVATNADLDGEGDGIHSLGGVFFHQGIHYDHSFTATVSHPRFYV